MIRRLTRFPLSSIQNMEIRKGKGESHHFQILTEQDASRQDEPLNAGSFLRGETRRSRIILRYDS